MGCRVISISALIAMLVSFVAANSFAQTSTYTCRTYALFAATQNPIQTGASAINTADTVVGQFMDQSFTNHGFIRHKDGELQTYSVPGAQNTQLSGINRAGVIVGTYDTHAFMRAHGNNTVIDFPGAQFSFGDGINNKGQIVGSYSTGTQAFGFLLSDGEYTTLQVPGSVSTIPAGINDAGVIVGRYFTSNFDSQGFVLINGQYVTLNFPSALNTSLGGVNNQGVIAGNWSDGTGGGGGFVYKNGKFLNAQIPNGTGGLNSISDQGDITGTVATSGGTVEAFLGENCAGQTKNRRSLRP